MTHSTWQTSAQHLVELALAEDLSDRGDVTSALSIPADATITGRIRAKEAGVIAGLEIVRMVYAQIDPAVTVDLLLTDGTSVEVGTVICEVRGAGRSVLSGERVALNFLQHLSGVASLTAKFVAAVKGTKAVILDTRKTTPGWRLLEKYAVRMGGGENHRIGLYDMVLIKDNHIDAAGGITAAVTAVQAAALPIEVEVKNLDELCEALTLKVDRILLDNMNLQQMRQAVTVTAGHVPLEASGNMALDRVAAVAATGVDYISVGALTHSAPALDLSMRLSS
ncbi:MAG: carboxylating nicotinate-nucleotide diphosphorylase [Anaerolineae bacterium]|nr:carboxylating nicotinate-nucleotide diphosphorylase [Anaerolineae bacterium]